MISVCGICVYIIPHTHTHTHALQSPSLEAVRDPSKPLPPRRAATKATKKMAALIIPVDTPGASLPSSSSNTKITTPSPSPSAPEVGVVSITAELRAAFIRKEIVECPHEVIFGFFFWGGDASILLPVLFCIWTVMYQWGHCGDFGVTVNYNYRLNSV